MALKLNGSTDGSVSLDAPADTSPTGTDVTLTLPTSAGSSGQYLQTNGSGTLRWQTVTDTNTQLTAGTSATLSASGAIFSSLPSGIRRITMTLWNVSMDTSAAIAIRIGDSGGIESSGYRSWDKRFGGSSFSTAGSTNQTGFTLSTPGTTATWVGQFVLTNPQGNDWVCASQCVDDSDNVRLQTGSKTLSGELDRIQIDVYSTGNIDGGSVNIFYEV